MLRKSPLLCRASTVALFLGLATLAKSELTISINLGGAAKVISPDLFGIFFEDINYAADGGLYAELIQNRSFEYDATDNPAWNGFTAWTLEQRNGGKGLWLLDVTESLHPNNPHYAILRVTQPGEVGISNEGFDGIPVKAGETYDLSFFARQLFMGDGWGASASIAGKPMPMIARLESKGGKSLGECELNVAGWHWTPFTASITATNSDPAARFVLLAKTKGAVALDHISLFPRRTFRDRKNGLRPDLAQAIADLHPKFVRFPGGCVAHGMGLHNIYRWKDTIGPIEQRRGQKNFWNYHQSMGLGYFEYFQFCEDIGAKPLPVLAAGVSCSNADQKRGNGQQCIPLADMPAYIQDVLDLIEWSNGPATSKWGSKRAAAGHPESFDLKYIGIGNEDLVSPEFKERFKMIQDAIQAKHPEIVVIGTAGSQPDGENFDEGWKFARELRTPMVDEHYYRPPQWFFDNLHRYDGYDRQGPKVYVGENAAHDEHRRSTLRSALAEAAFLTSLERNGDIVSFASYAPLIAKHRFTQWSPNLIYFNNTEVFPTLNYEVQKLFSIHAGDHWIESSLVPAAGEELPRDLAYSTVRDSASGDLIVKIVNGATSARALQLELLSLSSLPAQATRIVFSAADANIINENNRPPAARPETSTVTVSSSFDHEVPANSLTIFRIPSRQ